MFEFKILKKSKISRARLGILKTQHGEVETPAIVPVATQAVIKTLNSEQVLQTGSQILICNTFHLHQKPGEATIKAARGLHGFMNWKKPLMTDSGGFQVFSLGFGKDFNISKIIKGNLSERVYAGQQPKLLKIDDDGVRFRSFVDGRELFLGPKESMKIQADLEADIIFAFDECPPPNAQKNYVEKSLIRTHAWAKKCLKYRSSKQALFGIVQGGRYKDLRIASARFISSLPFEGFGIGGEMGGNVDAMNQMLSWVTDNLPEKKPRHMLGTGHPEDILAIIRSGADTFDSIVPTHYGRHGVAFTSQGRLDLTKSIYQKDFTVLDKKCRCVVCQNYSRSYIAHLFRAKEITGMQLLSQHNLFFFNQWLFNIRKQIKKGKL